MQRKRAVAPNLDYLHHTPKIIKWKVIAGGKLSPLQMYDKVYDLMDLKIRQLDVEENI